jgi:elongation factor Ts
MATASEIQKLREATGAGIMDCKGALQEASGDFDKAIKILKKKGLAKAARRADRSTGAGVLESYIHLGRVGVLLEVRCETDFVARSEPFQELAHDLAMHIAAASPEDVEALLGQAFIKDESKTIDDLVKDVISKTGENIQVERFCRYEL